ncbi:recombination protein NinG [Klebsiella pneumoniae]|nr:recombination protein NinG [Klebsiella pneumoniae]MDP0644305.1 recombination protein NinG [Klebsiella pneumoniae]MDP0732347.1 recombination protein NinG [Klebsiella pneumoniae]MDP0747784.1 recombination protein NinG [Klebsiella pneumoniae]
MLKRTQRRCKICREKFTPAFENHRWCCPEHGAEFAMQELEKKRDKQAQAKANENASEKTGLEGLDQNNPAPGIEKADKK